MLFIVTGEIQSGKTRWLEALVDTLSGVGVSCMGVLAPGRWVTHEQKGTACLEKVGIDNVLLPGGKRIAFAQRRDIIEDSDAITGATQSERARLGWVISDQALQIVNDYFIDLAAIELHEDDSDSRRLLIIDELGRLELERNTEAGLVCAIALLERGPTAVFPHAIVVVREGLCRRAYERLSPYWEDISVITPGQTAVEMICDAMDEPCSKR